MADPADEEHEMRPELAVSQLAGKHDMVGRDQDRVTQSNMSWEPGDEPRFPLHIGADG